MFVACVIFQDILTPAVLPPLTAQRHAPVPPVALVLSIRVLACFSSQSFVSVFFFFVAPKDFTARLFFLCV